MKNRYQLLITIDHVVSSLINYHWLHLCYHPHHNWHQKRSNVLFVSCSELAVVCVSFMNGVSWWNLHLIFFILCLLLWCQFIVAAKLVQEVNILIRDEGWRLEKASYPEKCTKPTSPPPSQVHQNGSLHSATSFPPFQNFFSNPTHACFNLFSN